SAVGVGVRAGLGAGGGVRAAGGECRAEGGCAAEGEGVPARESEGAHRGLLRDDGVGAGASAVAREASSPRHPAQSSCPASYPSRAERTFSIITVQERSLRPTVARGSRQLKDCDALPASPLRAPSACTS